MTDELGFGWEKRRQGNLDILSGKTTFRDEFRVMLRSVVANGHTFEQCKEELKKSTCIIPSSDPIIFLIVTFHLSLLWLLDIILDAGFPRFYEYCKEVDIPVVIISRYVAFRPFRTLGMPSSPIVAHVLDLSLCTTNSGMAPLIRAVLSSNISHGAEDIDIVSNEVDVFPDGTWEIKYRHPTR